MDNLAIAIQTLKKNVEGAKPVSYWIQNGAYIFRLTHGELDPIGCDYYIVDGDKVTPTNPAISRLSFETMKLL